jgi:hypothetical protein
MLVSIHSLKYQCVDHVPVVEEPCFPLTRPILKTVTWVELFPVATESSVNGYVKGNRPINPIIFCFDVAIVF